MGRFEIRTTGCPQKNNYWWLFDSSTRIKYDRMTKVRDVDECCSSIYIDRVLLGKPSNNQDFFLQRKETPKMHFRPLRAI